VHYTGKFTDGRKFDSSYDRGEPLRFKVGLGQVIRCWDEGLQHLQKGQKAVLTCPPDYAYGPRGVPGAIPPNSTLLFDVEVVDFK
jgi:FKBP-type peptidyl-prolyl cis-trans isomerase